MTNRRVLTEIRLSNTNMEREFECTLRIKKRQETSDKKQIKTFRDIVEKVHFLTPFDPIFARHAVFTKTTALLTSINMYNI